MRRPGCCDSLPYFVAVYPFATVHPRRSLHPLGAPHLVACRSRQSVRRGTWARVAMDRVWRSVTQELQNKTKQIKTKNITRGARRCRSVDEDTIGEDHSMLGTPTPRSAAATPDQTPEAVRDTQFTLSWQFTRA